MRRLLSRVLVALTLITGIGVATTGVAAANPAQSAPTKVSAPTSSGSKYQAQDWWA